MAPKRKIGATSSIPVVEVVNKQSSQNKQKRVRTAFSLIKLESENGRLRKEKEVGFGNSPADFTGLPISHTFKDWCLRDEVVGGTKDNHGNEVDDASHGKFLILPLNEFPRDEELREHAKDDPIEEARLILNRNMNVVIRDHVKRLLAIEAKKNQAVEVLDDIVISSTDKLFEDADWLRNVDNWTSAIFDKSTKVLGSQNEELRDVQETNTEDHPTEIIDSVIGDLATAAMNALEEEEGRIFLLGDH
ncbi:unnamed protein product [Amaranthus hypochondriacus]